MLSLFALALGAATAPPAGPSSEPPAEVRKLMEDCSAHRFETTVKGTRKGKPHESKVKLCGVAGQTEAQWIGTLKDAIAKVDANAAMSPSVKQQIITAVNAEIVRLGANPASAIGTALVDAPPLPAPRRLPTVAAPEYSALPAFPPPPVAQPVTPSAGAITASGGTTLAAAATAYVPPLPRPRLSLTCFSDGDLAGNGPCFKFDRHTRVTVRAGEPLKDTLLRFVRNGKESVDHPLPPLAQGRSASFALPRQVCSRVSGGNLSIQIVRGPAGKPHLAQVVGTEGPYNLTC